MISDSSFARTELMLGADVMARLKSTRVAIFGLGGVGGWCAEALARSGIGHLLLVDSDVVATTNLNRQVMATTKTIGEPKVFALEERLRLIAPKISLDVRNEVYDATTAQNFSLSSYDYVIDAIDSLTEKALLIRHALSISTVTLFASMGAALKMNPLALRASEFRKIEGDALAKALRTKFKKTGGMPERKFTCVWSPERRENRGEKCISDDAWCARKARMNGSIVHTTATFGLALAFLVIEDIEKRLISK